MPDITRHLAGAALLALAAHAAHANTELVTNGGFEDTGSRTSSYAMQGSNGGNAPIPGWTLGTNPGTPGAYPNVNNPLNCLMYAGETTGLCGPNNAGPGGPWQFWQHPGASPNGGNFFGGDGDSTIAAPISQLVTGLTVGEQYTLSFYQAAVQQMGFDGATTERWRVSFGGDTQLSTLMNNDNHGKVDWNQQTMTFTASATSQVLSFLAVGTPNGLPPFVLLDGVSMVSAVPEPVSLSLFAAGLMGLSGVRRLQQRREARRTPAAEA